MRKLACLATLLICGMALAAPLCQVVAPAEAPPLVRQAAGELSAYLSRWGESAVPQSAAVQPGLPAIVVRLAPDDEGLGDEGYAIATAGKGKDLRVTVQGRTPLGVLHGAYRLLREYGFGFYFDGDAVPPRPPRTLAVPALRAAPVFAIRGSLPWYNFLNSPTTWDDQDFRFFADQIIRSGQNFIGFHTYDHEPFGAYEYDGQVLGGEPLRTTESSVWGTSPLAVDDFGFGSGRLFPGKFWGSDVARQPGRREERIAAQKALLARGLAYASARGVKTCLGFEVHGDPTDPREQRRFRARFLQLLRDYPMLDYVWLWQGEARSMEGTTPPPLHSQGGRVYRQWEQAFAYTGSPARRWEGMRVAYYGLLAQRLLDSQAPGVKLVLSGWGGDQWLHVSDYFPAWDQVLDKRIIFAALDNIRVTPQVSQYYKLPADRERWAIPWYEYDGDQWFPQANAAIFSQTVRDAREKGCQGLVAIHWRTKEVGESQALVADYAWNPERTLEAFYQDYGTRRVGGASGRAYGRVLQELDALGYRWLGGAGQMECGAFAWCHVDDAARVRKLRELRQRLVAIRASLRTGQHPSGAVGRVEDTIATLDRGLLFNEVARAMVAGGPVDQALSLPADDPQRAARCARLLEQLPHEHFARMLDLWAQTITSRGEMGVLATINGKAYADYRDKVRRLQEAAGTDSPLTLARPLPAPTGLVSDYQQTSVAAGMPLVVRCAAFEGLRPARRVTLLYRTPGMSQWVTLPMRRLERCVFETTIPSEAVQAGWVRYTIAAETRSGPLQWPQLRGEPYRQVTVFPAEALVARANEVRIEPPTLPEDLALTAQTAQPGTVQLAWRAPGMVEVGVQRRLPGADWVTLGQTLDNVWEDSKPSASTAEYRLVAPDGRALATVTADGVAPRPPTPPTGLTVRPRGKAVRLSWRPADLSVDHYTIERAVGPEGPFTPVDPDLRVAAEGLTEHTFVDRPRQTGTVYYRLVAHGRPGTAPAYGAPVAAQVLAEVLPPLLAVDFAGGHANGTVAGLEFSGPYELTEVDGRGVLRTQGGFTLPYSDAIAVREAFTVAIRFRLGEMTPIPVLVSQGAWAGPGYFVQLMGPQLRFYVGGAGVLDRPVNIRPGEWHTVVCTYDGAYLASYLDGALLGEKVAEGPMQPSDAHFTVARYTTVGPEWTFKGDVDFVRLYGAALEPWMAMRADPTREAVVDIDWSTTDLAVGGLQAVWHQEPRVETTDRGPAAVMEGGLTIPFGDLVAVGDCLTIETSFCLNSTEGMPVLVNQGLWPGEGYMLQVLARRLRFHIGGVGSLDCGPELEPGRWYAVKCTYDGEALRVWLDGELVGERRSAAVMMPSGRPLHLGRYEQEGEAYILHGLLRRTRILGTVD